MSDPTRKDFTTQITEKATPESHKTTGQKIKESVTDTLDRAKSAMTPDSEKSVTQQAADKTRGAYDNTENH